MELKNDHAAKEEQLSLVDEELSRYKEAVVQYNESIASNQRIIHNLEEDRKTANEDNTRLQVTLIGNFPSMDDLRAGRPFSSWLGLPGSGVAGIGRIEEKECRDVVHGTK